MPEILVTQTSPDVCRVVVREGGSETQHDVTVTAEVAGRYAPGTPVDELVRASFEFLLEREPKESILRRFDLPVIEQYFPEYPRWIARALKPG